MKIPSLLLVTAVLSLAGTPAFAGSLLFSGDTTGLPTFNRPTEPGDLLSDVGTDVPYFLQPFTVNLSGNYNLSVVAENPANFDTFLELYSGLFNAASPLDNLVGANDDAVNGNADAGSALALQPLVAGTTYYMVVDGFLNSDAGAFNANISGPGEITVVPEPTTFGLAGLGLASLWLLQRRQSARA